MSQSKITSFRMNCQAARKLSKIEFNSRFFHFILGMNVQDFGDLNVFVPEADSNESTKLKNAIACGLNAKLVNTIQLQFPPSFVIGFYILISIKTIKYPLTGFKIIFSLRKVWKSSFSYYAQMIVCVELQKVNARFNIVTSPWPGFCRRSVFKKQMTTNEFGSWTGR